jgi:hypothetical protein
VVRPSAPVILSSQPQSSRTSRRILCCVGAGIGPIREASRIAPTWHARRGLFGGLRPRFLLVLSARPSFCCASATWRNSSMTGSPIDRAYTVQTEPTQTDGRRTSVAPATGITRELQFAMSPRAGPRHGTIMTRDRHRQRRKDHEGLRRRARQRLHRDHRRSHP